MTRRQPAEIRRQRILDAAGSLLVHEGLDGTSMDAVAAAADIAKGTLYLYFPSRSVLLTELRRRYAEDLARKARSVLRSERPWTGESLATALQRMISELTEYLVANRGLHHVLFREAGVSEEETLAPLRELLRQTLAEGMADGAIEPVDPDVLMRFLLDGLHGALLPLLHQGGRGRRRLLATLDGLVRRLLRARPAAES